MKITKKKQTTENYSNGKLKELRLTSYRRSLYTLLCPFTLTILPACVCEDLFYMGLTTCVFTIYFHFASGQHLVTSKKAKTE